MSPPPRMVWSDQTGAACVAELLRRDHLFSAFRGDRMRLPVAPSERLNDGDRIQCFHDSRTGFHDWAQVWQGDEIGEWKVKLVEWRERDGELSPPRISSLGDLLDSYRELRINNHATATKRSEPASKQERPGIFERIFDGGDDDDSWLEKSNKECLDELTRRCEINAPLRLRFRMPTPSATPRDGDLLQLFHDKLTGFCNYGRLLQDKETGFYFVRVYETRGGKPRLETTAPCVDIPIGEVLDQHAELRVMHQQPS